MGVFREKTKNFFRRKNFLPQGKSEEKLKLLMLSKILKLSTMAFNHQVEVISLTSFSPFLESKGIWEDLEDSEGLEESLDGFRQI